MEDQENLLLNKQNPNNQRQEKIKKYVQIVATIIVIILTLYCYISSFINGFKGGDFEKKVYNGSESCQTTTCYYYPLKDAIYVDVDKENCFIDQTNFFLDVDLTGSTGYLFMYFGIFAWGMLFRVLLFLYKAQYNQMKILIFQMLYNLTKYYLNTVVFQFQNMDCSGKCIKVKDSPMGDASNYAAYVGMSFLSSGLCWAFISLYCNLVGCFIFCFYLGIIVGCIAFNVSAALVLASPVSILGIAIPFKILMVYYILKGCKEIYDIWQIKKKDSIR